MLVKPHQYAKHMMPAHLNRTQFIQLLQHPTVITDKASAPLAIWGIMTENVQLDEASGMPRNIGNNIDRIYALQLDYDDGTTIGQFIETYSEWEFYLYTSYSYGFKQGDRFRVIMPLAEPIMKDLYNPLTKQHLCQHFRGADETFKDWGHWQILPCVRSSTAPYRFHINHGTETEKLDLFSLDFQRLLKNRYDQEQAARLAEEEAARAIRDNILIMPAPGEAAKTGNHDMSGAVNWAQQQLDLMTEGSRNHTMWNVLCWLKSKEVDRWDASCLQVPPDCQREFDSMLDRLFA